MIIVISTAKKRSAKQPLPYPREEARDRANRMNQIANPAKFVAPSPTTTWYNGIVPPARFVRACRVGEVGA